MLHLSDLCMILVSTVLHLLSKIFLVLSEFCLFGATFLEKTGADCALRLEVVLVLAVFFVRSRRLRGLLCGLHSLGQALRQQNPWLLAGRD